MNDAAACLTTVVQYSRYGVYYAARELQAAISETAHHFALFAADSGDGSCYEDMRVLAGQIDADFHDIASLPSDACRAILDPHDYASGRALGARLREAGSNGVVYPSVRHAGGECIRAFRPKCMHPPSEERHLRYHYDGIRVRRWFDYGSGAWTAL